MVPRVERHVALHAGGGAGVVYPEAHGGAAIELVHAVALSGGAVRFADDPATCGRCGLRGINPGLQRDRGRLQRAVIRHGDGIIAAEQPGLTHSTGGVCRGAAEGAVLSRGAGMIECVAFQRPPSDGARQHGWTDLPTHRRIRAGGGEALRVALAEIRVRNIRWHDGDAATGRDDHGIGARAGAAKAVRGLHDDVVGARSGREAGERARGRIERQTGREAAGDAEGIRRCAASGAERRGLSVIDARLAIWKAGGRNGESAAGDAEIVRDIPSAQIRVWRAPEAHGPITAAKRRRAIGERAGPRAHAVRRAGISTDAALRIEREADALPRSAASCP